MLLRATMLSLATLLTAMPAAGTPRITPLTLAVAQAASDDPAVATFYRSRDFAPIWMGPEGDRAVVARRAAFLRALDRAGSHGLPLARYDPAVIRAEFAHAADGATRGALEVAMTRRLLGFARDVSAGILEPGRVDPEIKLEIPAPDPTALLEAFTTGDPETALQSLWPKSPVYRRLLREKMRLEEIGAAGGWGPDVPEGTLRPGDVGPGVMALRDRLMRMGYLDRTASAVFDAALEAALRDFQTDHGLDPDGQAGPATRAALNVPVEVRLGQILVGLERQRWMNRPLEPRHILVNLAEQRAYVVDDGRVTFETNVVVGKDTPGRRTPEFSHEMTHMVINPTWNVPRSITVNEYLPALQRGGARHLDVYSRNGKVNPSAIDFTRYTAATFPFSLKQPPGPQNALGRVKFMFPNRWNIYLHDTPARSLFARDVRTFSHGCVRVARPLELAYHLLAAQSDTPERDFDSRLATGRETRVNLERPVGVHIVYWSAWVTPEGRVQYRGDPYGRDATVLDALRDAGVELSAERS